MIGARPSLVRGSMMIATSLAIAGVLSFVTSIIIARSVGVTDFGFYSITISLQNIAILFSSFSLGMAITKFVAEYTVRDAKLALKFAKTGIRLVLLFASVTAVIYFSLADVIGNGLYDEPAVAELIPLSVMVAFSSAMMVFASGLAQGNQRLKLVSAIQMSTPIISLSIIVVLLPDLGVKAAFIGFFIAQMTVATLSTLRLSRTGFPLFSKVDAPAQMPYSRMLLSFAIPSVMSAVMVTPILWFGNTVLTLESGFQAMGLFGVAMVFFTGLNMLATSVSIPLVPRVSEMSVRSMERIGPLISTSMRSVSFLFFPLFFAVALFSEEIIGVLYGSDFHDASEAAFLMVTACYFCAVATPVGSAITGLGRMWVALALNMIWAAMFVVLVLFLTPSGGPTGLGLAFAVSYGVHVGVSLVVARKVVHLMIGKVLIGIVPSMSFFALAIISVAGEAPVYKALFFVLGSALMLGLGRKDVRHVLDRFQRR